jgi:glycosyltransferase involved in cell wall biosynthesis
MRLAVNAWFWDRPTTGSGQYTRRLVEGIAALAPEVEVHLIAPGPRWFRTTRFEFQSSGPFQLGAEFSRPNADRLTKVWFEQVAFPRACAHLDADVAHVPYWAPPLRPGAPAVITIHDLIPLLLPEYRGGLMHRLYTSLASAAARNAAMVLTDSEASRRDIVAHLGLPAERVRAIPLAAGERFRPESAADDVAIRERYGLPERYLLYLGGFDRRKNVVTALRACRRVRSSIGSGCPLVIAGRLPEQDSGFAPDPRRLAREEGLDERFVRFIGFVDEAHKPAVYRGAVAFIFPSRYEGFGLPPLEAMACGIPVVGSEAASLPEVIGNGGLLLPPDDAAGMADALIRLVLDDDFRARMSQQALAQASGFSWKRTARQTLVTYKMLMDVGG